MKNIAVVLLGGTAFAALACVPSVAQQAPTSGAASSETFETVVVTAQRREESSQKTPVAVTALSDEMLRTQRVETATDLQYLAPSLVVSSPINRDDDKYSIRGQGPTAPSTAAVLVGGGNGVETYFADAISYAAGAGLYYDLQSVQVVNGPQGTLFGKATTGGVVIFTPHKPTNNFEGYGEVGFGNYGMESIDAAVNFPIISDKLMVRIAGEGYLRDGYTIDRGPYFPGKDYDNRNYWTMRATILFRPIESVENETIFTINNSQENGTGRILTGVNPAYGFASLLQPALAEQQAAGVRSTAFSTDTFSKHHRWEVVNTTRWFINDDITFKNIATYQSHKYGNADDIDGTVYPFSDLTGAHNYPWHLQTGYVTEEAQLQGTSLGGDLQWTTGVYYEYDHDTGPQPFDQLSWSAALPVVLDLTQPFATDTTRSTGVYAQTTFDLGRIWEAVRGLKLTTGYRYTWDSYDVNFGFYVANSNALGLPANLCASGLYGASPTFYPASNCAIGGKGKSSAASWTLGLDYQLTDDTLVYVRSARGYLPGGFNPMVFDDTSPYRTFKPASVIDTEGGVKSQFTVAGMNTMLDANVFYSTYHNMQRPVSLIFSGINTGGFINAAESEIYGVELQGSIIPFAGLRLSTIYSYNYGHYSDIDPLVAPQLVGIPFADLPNHKFTLTADYTLPLPENIGAVDVSASYSYQSRYFDSTAVQPQDHIQPYGLLNLGLNWRAILGTSWDASFNMTNVGDKTYRVGQNGIYDAAAGTGEITSIYGEPRMYVFKLRYSFGPGFN